MAIQAEGIQASGQAGIFGNSINPLQYLMQQQARQQNRQAELAKQQREDRDKLLDYNSKYNPSSKNAVFNYRIAENAQKVRDFTMGAYRAGVPIERVTNEAERMKGVINAYISEVDQWKATLDDIESEIEKGELSGKYVKGARGKLRDVYLNPDGSLKDDGEIRKGMAEVENIFNDPEIYNKGGVIMDWIKNLPEQSRSVYSKKMTPGYTPTDLENTVISKLRYETDEDGLLKLNDQGEKIPIIDEATYELAKLNPDLKLLMESNGGKTKDEQINWLKQNIPGGTDSVKSERKIVRGVKLDQKDAWRRDGFSGRVNPEAVKDRFENNEAIVNGFRPDILANTFSPFEDQKVHYVDSEGRSVAAQRNGQYYDENGRVIGKPSKIRVEFNAKVNPYAIQGIMMDPNLSDDEKQQAMVESMKSGGTVTRNFDITNESGRRQAHEALNRILDEYLPMNSRYGEDYTKLVRDKYEKGSGGVYKTKQETGGVY